MAYYCFRCGDSLQGRDGGIVGKRASFAVAPGEDTSQLALISSIMPHTNRQTAGNYRWALLITAFLTLAFTVTGLLPAAIVAAAFLVPETYLLYIYDANVWEEAPLPVIGLLFLFTGILSVIVSLVFFKWIFNEELVSLLTSTGGRGGIGSMSLVGLLIFAALLPIVAEVAKHLGPLLLLRRPLFDDMIDAFTFGVAAGTAYAAFETVVAFGSVFTSPETQTTTGLGGWVVVILNVMIVKSVIYGSATGIAIAAYSGIGRGQDGFTRRYFSAFGLAVAANVAYWLGIRLLAYAPFGQALGLLWGIAIAALLILKVRSVLQVALLEAAVEAAASGSIAQYVAPEGSFCPECEVALLPGGAFCIVCGSAIGAASHQSRRRMHGTGVAR